MACLVFVFVSAGRRKGSEGASLNVADRLPLDLYAAICWAAVFGLLLAVVAVADTMIDNTWPFLVTRNGVMFVVTVAICAYTGILIALAPFLSFATRLKVGGGIWWRNSAYMLGVQALLARYKVVLWSGQTVFRMDMVYAEENTRCSGRGIDSIYRYFRKLSPVCVEHAI